MLSTTDKSIYSIPENKKYAGMLGTGRVNAYAAALKAAETATKKLKNITYSNSQLIQSNYGIKA